jgi:UDP-N-acetylglucosamine--dolichyl-phosphate N-acetylglucosaminephosphotransferase
MIDSYTLFLLIISILLSSRMKSAGVSGIDVHKVGKPQISEMGGFAIYAGLATSLIVATFLGISLELIFISLLVVTLSAMVGALDDVMHLGAWEKPLLGYFAGIPLILAAGRDPYLFIPVLGSHGSLLYPLPLPLELTQ